MRAGLRWIRRESGTAAVGAGALIGTAAVALSRDPVTLALWLFAWLLAVAAQWRQWRGVPFYLWIAAGLLYPQASDRFSSFNEFAAVNGVLLLVMAMSSLGAAMFVVRRHLGVASVVGLWLVWGALVYVPVLLSWAFRTAGLAEQLLPGLYNESSALKTAGPVLFAWAPAFGAVAAIRGPESARRFINFLMVVTLAFAGLSLVQLVVSGYQGSWVPVTYSILPSRLHSISSPDANSTARQALPALVVLLPLAVFGRRLVRPWLLWPALCAGAGVMLLTLSRTAMISFSAAILVVVVTEIHRRRTMMVAGGLVLALVSAVAVLAVSGVIGAERLSLTNVSGRLELYEAVWTVIAAHPIFGVHPGGYAAALSEAGYPRLISPHNMWFGVAAEWGLPMAVWLTGALVATWAVTIDGLRRLRRVPRLDGWREARVLLVGASALAATWSVHGISEIVPAELVFFALGLALTARYRLLPAIVRQAAESAAGKGPAA